MENLAFLKYRKYISMFKKMYLIFFLFIAIF